MAAQHPTTFLMSSLVFCSLHKLHRNSTQVQNDNPGLTSKTLSPFQLSQISFPCCIWSKVALQCLWPAFNFSWLFFFLFAYCIVNIIQRQTWKKIHPIQVLAVALLMSGSFKKKALVSDFSILAISTHAYPICGRVNAFHFWHSPSKV